MLVEPYLNETERQRLLAQYAEIATLAGGLAHEIKNPLSTIGLNLELLAEDLDPERDARRPAFAHENSIRAARVPQPRENSRRVSAVRPRRRIGAACRQISTMWCCDFIDFYKPQAGECGNRNQPAPRIRTAGHSARSLVDAAGADEPRPQRAAGHARTAACSNCKPTRATAASIWISSTTAPAWTSPRAKKCFRRSFRPRTEAADWDCPPREKLSKPTAGQFPVKASPAAAPASPSRCRRPKAIHDR